MMPLRNVIYIAVNNGWIPRDPFFAYHISKEETKRGGDNETDQLHSQEEKSWADKGLVHFLRVHGLVLARHGGVD